MTSPGALGFWLAGALAVLTLTHELGHAATARAFGADAEISLDLMAGYTSFVPTRPMSIRERTAVILAGPMAEIVPGLVALILLGANPLSYESVTATDARWAIWWAGPVLGLFNLVPLLPLDGGMVVATALDRFVPGRGRLIALIASIVVTVGIVVAVLFSPRFRLLALFAGALLVAQVLQLRSELRPPRPSIMRSPGQAIVEQLLESGDTKRAAEFGAHLFEQERTAEVAVLVAQVCGAGGRDPHGDGLAAGRRLCERRPVLDRRGARVPRRFRAGPQCAGGRHPPAHAHGPLTTLGDSATRRQKPRRADTSWRRSLIGTRT